MSTLGKTLVIWGLGVPTMTLPLTLGYRPSLGLLGSLPDMRVYLADTSVPYPDLIALSLLVATYGASLWAVGGSGRRGDAIKNRRESDDAQQGQRSTGHRS